jgi:hypothetical protein
MAKAYASAIIEAPIEVVWPYLRNFNGLSDFHPAIARSEIEDGLDADVVGCVRSFHLVDGGHVRERLLMLDDARFTLSYNFETPAFPVENYVATVRMYPVTQGDATFCEWEAVFDETPADKGKYVEIISDDVFAAGWAALRKQIGKDKRSKPDGCAALEGLGTQQGLDLGRDHRACGRGLGPHARFRRHGRLASRHREDAHAWRRALRQGLGRAGFLFRPRPSQRGAAAPRRHRPLLLLPDQQERDALDELRLGCAALADHRDRRDLRGLDRRLGRFPARRSRADADYGERGLPEGLCDAERQILQADGGQSWQDGRDKQKEVTGT